MDESQKRELRKRRSSLAAEARAKQDRDIHGPRIVAALIPAVGSRVTLADFKPEFAPSVQVESLRLKEASDWAEVSVSKERAAEIAACMDKHICSSEGAVGVLANQYLGFCKVQSISVKGMVDAAETIEDTVVFYPRNMRGAILVDCYRSPPGFPPFSLFVQGKDLALRFAACFES